MTINARTACLLYEIASIALERLAAREKRHVGISPALALQYWKVARENPNAEEPQSEDAEAVVAAIEHEIAGALR